MYVSVRACVRVYVMSVSLYVCVCGCEYDIFMRSHFMCCSFFQPVEQFNQQSFLFHFDLLVVSHCYHHLKFEIEPSNGIGTHGHEEKVRRVGSIKGVALINNLLQFTFSIVTIQISFFYNRLAPWLVVAFIVVVVIIWYNTIVDISNCTASNFFFSEFCVWVFS